MEGLRPREYRDYRTFQGHEHAVVGWDVSKRAHSMVFPEFACSKSFCEDHS